MRRAIFSALLLMCLVSPARAQRRHEFVCVPASAFALGPAYVGETRDSVLARLGAALAVRADTVHGADYDFAITRYRYLHLEFTISEASGRVAEIRALTSRLRTPLGLHLGMPRAEVEQRLPPGAMHAENWTPRPVRTDSLEVSSCGGRASTMSLHFGVDGRLTELTLNGFYPRQ